MSCSLPLSLYFLDRHFLKVGFFVKTFFLFFSIDCDYKCRCGFCILFVKRNKNIDPDFYIELRYQLSKSVRTSLSVENTKSNPISPCFSSANRKRFAEEKQGVGMCFYRNFLPIDKSYGHKMYVMGYVRRVFY